MRDASQMMHAWLTDLQHLLAHGDAAVLVTVARVEGSAPREPGAKMVVSRDDARHTIGGGHLEWKAIELARQMLKEGEYGLSRRLVRLALGPSLGQCCGGAVMLAFERLTVADLGWVTSLAKRVGERRATVRTVSFAPAAGAALDPVRLSEPEPGVDVADCLLWDGAGFDDNGALLTETITSNPFDVLLFGAGHVGAALVRVLAMLPCVITWIDSRDAPFAPEFTREPGAWPNLTIDENDAPVSAVDAAPANAYFLVMTHNHALDQELAERILRRADYAYFGMIGSKTKRRQFEHRLAARGIDPAQIARMTCPIGVEGITGKAPESIAIAVAAQLLRVVEQRFFHPTRLSP